MAKKTKAIYLDCFSGISGNMMLGALIQVGVPAAELKAALKKLPVSGYEFNLTETKKCGISAAYVNIIVTQRQPHRHLSDIIDIIDKADLSERVRDKSKEIFTRLAQAEAKVHETGINKVHFHEVGAVDAIIDVVGTVWALERLGVEEIYSSSLHVGKGFVKCAHGIMPVPAPATAELLKGVPHYQKDIEKELVTPTGAALVSVLSLGYGSMQDNFAVEKTGYGAGTWDIEIPNVLRIYLGEIFQKAKESKVLALETNIDDLNPQLQPYILERLFSSGALDAYLTPIVMKKGRLAAKLSVLCRSEMKDVLAKIIFAETSALGLRIYEADRIELKREFLQTATPWGKINVKIGFYQDKISNILPEFEECRLIAQKAGIPLKAVQEIALQEAFKMLGISDENFEFSLKEG